MSASTCRRRTVVETKQFRIDACSCGHFHLHLGPVTLHFNGEALRRLGEGILRAVESPEDRQLHEETPLMQTHNVSNREH